MASATMSPVSNIGNHATEDSEHVSLKTWICVMGVLLGCFMAVLDIIVTN